MPATAVEPTLELRPSDAVNLADDRVECEPCLGTGMPLADDKHGHLPDQECPDCHGKGSRVNPTGRDHLSHSSISTQLNCLKKLDWSKVRRLELIERPKALSMGSAFQKSIELSDPDIGPKLLRGDRQVVTQDDEDRLAKDETTVRAAAALYLDVFGTPEHERREVEYRVRLRSPWTGRPSQTFDLLGYADGVIDAPEWLELVENKLVGQVDKAMMRRLPLDRQVSLACYGLWRATGKAVRVVYYRTIRKPSIKQRQNESVDEFCERLAADYANPERRDFYSHEEPLFRTDKDLLLIEAELWDWAEQLRNARRRDFYARNTSHCHDYGGCPFIPLCVGDPDAMSLYRERPERELAKEAQEK